MNNMINKAADYILKMGKPSAEAIIETIKIYISEHFCEKIKLKEIADRFYISQEHLCRLFKKETGIGFHEYLTSMRMEKAKELIKKHKMKIEEVAVLVGYDNVHHFSNVFKKHFSENPSMLKKQA